jgi:hypothetical protein
MDVFACGVIQIPEELLCQRLTRDLFSHKVSNVAARKKAVLSLYSFCVAKEARNSATASTLQ